MNLHTTEIHTKVPQRRVKKSSRKSKNSNIGIIFGIVAVLLLIFIFFASRALLNSETEKLKRISVGLKSDLKGVDREVADLKMRQAHYHGRYIITQIKKFNLKLQNPEVGQVKRVEIALSENSNINDIEIGNLLFSQR